MPTSARAPRIPCDEDQQAFRALNAAHLPSDTRQQTRDDGARDGRARREGGHVSTAADKYQEYRTATRRQFNRAILRGVFIRNKELDHWDYTARSLPSYEPPEPPAHALFRAFGRRLAVAPYAYLADLDVVDVDEADRIYRVGADGSSRRTGGSSRTASLTTASTAAGSRRAATSCARTTTRSNNSRWRPYARTVPLEGPRLPYIFTFPTTYHVGTRELFQEEGLLTLSKGDGVLWGDGTRYRVVDTWLSFDKHGRFDVGMHVFLEPVEPFSDDDRLGRLARDYFTP
jgi:hypothetical protein